jgi:hypothetical protein|tara:strand:+ start:208 stop:390 length:183 start_codon:yes stop_codon:yes gene_type:complete
MRELLKILKIVFEPHKLQKFQFAILNLQLNSEVIKVYLNHDICDCYNTIKKVFKYLRRYS